MGAWGLPMRASVATITPPTFVSENEAPWNQSSTPQTSSVTVATNDTLIAVGATADAATTLSTPTGGTGITWTLQNSIVVSSYCAVYLWVASIASGQTFTYSQARGGSTDVFGFNVFRHSGSGGFGATNKGNVSGAAPSLSLTTQQANSAVVMICADWNAADGASRTYRTVNGITPSSGNGLEKTYFRDSAKYTIYAALWNDAGAAGANTYGLSAPTGQKYAMILQELKGL